MGFKEMIDDLVAKGLLDHERKLTPKGHDYVGEIKDKYRKKTKPFNYEMEDAEPYSDSKTDKPVIEWN